MIYSVNFLEMTMEINPLAVCKYLEQTGWILFPNKRQEVRIYQIVSVNDFRQVMVPMDKSLIDYKSTMFDVIKNVSEYEKKSVEQVMLYLLNPDSDIIKIRFDKNSVESGNILFDDAIKLFDNAKKILAATALDIINPKQIHYGRIDDSVQRFLNQCRFGQTEIGSYVVSIVCPFADLSGEGFKQLSIFSDEDRCAHSLTRRVTNKLMDDIALVKESVDNGTKERLLESEIGISSNFLEALNGINSQSENTVIDFSAEWAPAVKTNRSNHSRVRITNDYYEPIASLIEKIKDKTEQYEEILGRIKKLTAAPSVDQRQGGTIEIVFLSKENRKKTIAVDLGKDDYEKAIAAHQHGRMVRVLGTMTNGKGLKMKNAMFSILE